MTDHPRPPWLRGARAAFVFFTRLPVGGFPYRDDDFRWAAAWFPLVGAAVGTVAASIWLATASESHLGPWIGCILAMIGTVLLTGAMHEDGLADTADALGGTQDRAKVFVILKDSRIGTFGTCAVLFSTLLRIASMVQLNARLGTEHSAAFLVLAPILARTAPVWLMSVLPYVSPKEQAKSTLIAAAGRPQALVATALATTALLVTIALGIIGLPQAALIVVGLACLAATLGGWFFARAGGLTGDFLGTVVVASEQLVLLMALLMSSRGVPH